MDCSQILKSVSDQLQQQYQIAAFGNECILLTPFLNADAAPVEIYIQQRGDKFRLSDAGEALNQLFVNGLVVENNKRLTERVLIAADLNNVHFEDSELFVEVTFDNLGKAVRNLANTIQATSFLIYKRTHTARLKFGDKVEQFLIVNEVTYESTHRLKGYANNHTIPLFVNSNRNVLIEPLSARTVSSARRKAKNVAYQWLDLQKSYADRFKYTVILDDESAKRQELWEDRETHSALVSYSTHVLNWSTGKDSLLELIR